MPQNNKTYLKMAKIYQSDIFLFSKIEQQQKNQKLFWNI